MAFCSNCGTQLAEGAKFCPNCGTKVGEAQVSDVQTVDTQQPQEELSFSQSEQFTQPQQGSYVYTPAEPQEKKKKKGCRKVFMIVLIGIVVLAILGAILGGGSNEDTVANESADANTTTKQTQPSTNTKQPSKTTQNVTMSKEDYMASCVEVDYEDVARNPKSYEKKDIVVEGTVIQVQEGSFNSVVMRVCEEGSFGDSIWYVTYTRESSDESRILEDDYVTLYGTCDGIETYTALLGNNVSIPSVKAKYIENGKVVDGKTITFDKDEIAKQLEYKEYCYDSMFSDYYFLAVKNTSVYDLDITANVTFYSGESVVAVESRSADAVAIDQEALIWTMPDEEYDRTEVSFEVSQSSFTTPAIEDFEYEIVNQTSSKLIIKGKNISDKTMDSASIDVLFFKGDELVGHDNCYMTDSDYELKGNSEVTKEVELYGETFDNFLIFVNAYRY